MRDKLSAALPAVDPATSDDHAATHTNGHYRCVADFWHAGRINPCKARTGRDQSEPRTDVSAISPLADPIHTPAAGIAVILQFNQVTGLRSNWLLPNRNRQKGSQRRAAKARCQRF